MLSKRQGGDLFRAAEIGLVDDARTALDAGTVDDVVVKFTFLALEGSHSRGTPTTSIGHISSIIIECHGKIALMNRVIPKSPKRNRPQTIYFQRITASDPHCGTTFAV